MLIRHNGNGDFSNLIQRITVFPILFLGYSRRVGRNSFKLKVGFKRAFGDTFIEL